MVAGIRKVVKQHCPSVSVTQGRGSACLWVNVYSSGRVFTGEEIAALNELRIQAGGNCAVLRPEEVAWYYQFLVQKMEAPKVYVPKPSWD